MSELIFNVPPTQRSYEMGSWFKVLYQRPKKWGIISATPELVVQPLHLYVKREIDLVKMTYIWCKMLMCDNRVRGVYWRGEDYKG